MHMEGSDSDQVSRVTLHLGPTDYRTFVGTNLNPLWDRLLVPSEDDVTRCQHTSSPLGNGAIVETADKKIMILRRSNNDGEFSGHYVFPGDHPEPEEVGISSHLPYESSLNFETYRKFADEMFDSIIREVTEEIGVPAMSLMRYKSAIQLHRMDTSQPNSFPEHWLVKIDFTRSSERTWPPKCQDAIMVALPCIS